MLIHFFPVVLLLVAACTKSEKDTRSDIGSNLSSAVIDGQALILEDDPRHSTNHGDAEKEADDDAAEKEAGDSELPVNKTEDDIYTPVQSGKAEDLPTQSEEVVMKETAQKEPLTEHPVEEYPPLTVEEHKKCTNSISATTLRYRGPSTVKPISLEIFSSENVKAVYSNVKLETGKTIPLGHNGFSIDAGPGEKLGSKTTIRIVWEEGHHEEIIHTSCSAIYWAGAPAPLDRHTPNPHGSVKGAPSPHWQIVNFRQQDNGFIEE